MTKLEENFEISRDPSEWKASTHLLQRIRERDILEKDVVAEVIEEGEIVDFDENKGGEGPCFTLKGEWLFSTFEVKVCPATKGIKTAYEVES
jgi:hypothetical protein